MISIDFYTGLLPLTRDIFHIRENDTGPLFSDETLSWFEENNMTVFMEGEYWCETFGSKITTYRKPISEMTLDVYANTSCSYCKLVFENSDDALLFKLTWC